jgi:polysaccharide chain length determinant protein (PEP-CTERM system associated)
MNFDLHFYWRLLVRRLPAMLAIVIICSVIGVVVAMRAPTTYRTEARLVVEDAQIPGDLASSTVRTEANTAIEIIRQRLLTRANMLDIAFDMNVFENYSAMSPDDIVGQMRNATNIRSRGGRNGEPIIVTVAFEARSGQIAANVVNEYVTRIVNANVELRTGSAEETLAFFEQEVQRLSTELDLQNARITQFQTENADALPDDQPFRLSRLALLQERLANAERERTSLIDQRARIVAIFEATGEIAATGASPLSPDQQQLQQLERELANALLVFSETNPQVQLLQRRIEQLRSRVDNDVAAPTGNDDGERGSATPGGATVLEVQLVQIDSQIETLDAIAAGARDEIARLEDAIRRTPLNAITLRSLERDYENVRRQYDRVVASLAEANTGERIEVTARGQRISIIEAANVPREPAGANRVRTVAMGVATGLGLAGGLFVLLEFLNRSVRRPAEITSALGITPLATIPFIEDPRRLMMRRTMRFASFVIILVGVPAALWAVDTYYLPLDQLAQRILQRVGLA